MSARPTPPCSSRPTSRARSRSSARASAPGLPAGTTTRSSRSRASRRRRRTRTRCSSTASGRGRRSTRRRPPSRIRTQGGDSAGPARVRLVPVQPRRREAGRPAFRRRLARRRTRASSPTQDESTWPDGVLMLGDQVYADETTEATQRRIRAKREITDDGPGTEVADFEEYTWLYLESWTDPDVRWLMSTVGSSMIFDDHDVRDDWNTSHEWRDGDAADVVVAGPHHRRPVDVLDLPAPRQPRPGRTARQRRCTSRCARTAATSLRCCASSPRTPIAEADGAKGTRWSYRRDFGRVRLLMIDSRCGRILADGSAAWSADDEFAWIEKQTDGEYDHLLIGTSLPWLLGRALHDVEAWDEVLCDGKRRQAAGPLRRVAAPRRRPRALGVVPQVVRGARRTHRERRTPSRRAGDDLRAVRRRAPRLCRRGALPRADAFARLPADLLAAAQLRAVLHEDRVPHLLEPHRRAHAARAARRRGQGAEAVVHWQRLDGPFFGNEMAEFIAHGRSAETRLRKSAPTKDEAQLKDVARLDLAS